MKKSFILVISILLLNISSICSAGIMTDPIATLPFGKKLTVASSVRFEDTEEARELIQIYLTDYAQFNFITRTDIDKIVQEYRFQQSDLVDQATAVKLGNLVGAKYLLITNITSLIRNGDCDKVTLISKIVEVETGRIIASGRGIGKGNGLDEAFSASAKDVVMGKMGLAVKLGFVKKR